MAIQWKRRLAAGLVLAALPLIMAAGSLHFHCEEVRAAQVIKEEKGPYGCLTLPQNLNAVRSEVEIFKEIPKDLRADAPAATAIYRNTQVYTNSLMLDMRQLQAEKPLFYRVRAYDLDGHPIGPYSQPADVESALFKTERNAPIPHDPYGKGNGSVLLYPVYAYTGNPNAASYEIEVTSKYPENLHGFSPSVHRIYAAQTELTDLYDDAPRTGTYYWRVRGMDSTGKPVGEWSLPQEIKNPVKHWKVALSMATAFLTAAAISPSGLLTLPTAMSRIWTFLRSIFPKAGIRVRRWSCASRRTCFLFRRSTFSSWAGRTVFAPVSLPLPSSRI